MRIVTDSGPAKAEGLFPILLSSRRTLRPVAIRVEPLGIMDKQQRPGTPTTLEPVDDLLNSMTTKAS
jgi:hypothetical protein